MNALNFGFKIYEQNKYKQVVLKIFPIKLFEANIMPCHMCSISNLFFVAWFLRYFVLGLINIFIVHVFIYFSYYSCFSYLYVHTCVIIKNDSLVRTYMFLYAKSKVLKIYLLLLLRSVQCWIHVNEKYNIFCEAYGIHKTTNSLL